MDTIELAKNLIRYPTYDDNFQAKKMCLEFCKNYLKFDDSIIIKEMENNSVLSMLVSNIDATDFDILSIVHLDVVFSGSELFLASEKNGRLYGTGSFDMKSFVAMSMNNFVKFYTKNPNSNLKYGLLITTDEEIGGSHGALKWSRILTSKIILDTDAGLNIKNIAYKNSGTISINIANIPDFKNLLNDLNKYIINIEREVINLEYMKNKDEVLDILNKYGNGLYEILAEYPILEQNINSQYYKLYLECLKRKIFSFNLVSKNTVNDCSYFYNSDTVVISHQATGGGSHSKQEWLNIESLHSLEAIQYNYLLSLDKNYKMFF